MPTAWGSIGKHTGGIQATVSNAAIIGKGGEFAHLSPYRSIQARSTSMAASYSPGSSSPSPSPQVMLPGSVSVQLGR